MRLDDPQIFAELPDVESARRLLERLEEKHPREYAKLVANRSLLSDVLAIFSFSDFLAATLLENPSHLVWLDKRRRDAGVRSKEELVESLAQFRSTNSLFEPGTLYEKFRRRELLRIFLRDIRRLATIAEITEEISNLADAILESALREAITVVDNRFGSPQQTGKDGKALPATFCVVALGKLGSRELNYSSDIDLLFLYSGEGNTRGAAKPSVTNREYFVKLAEMIIKLTAQNLDGPSAYRVDMRLRPHGSLGALAMSVADTCVYYKTEARAWERQVLIRSRAAAGDPDLYASFFSEVEGLTFADTDSPDSAFRTIRETKQRMDAKASASSHDVKLGRGGIREIEFLAQGLQLAYGGRDRWLRSPHTLISLARLAEHGHLDASEVSELSAAYDFLRRTEHVLQMENGLQTHSLPAAPSKFDLLTARMKFAGYDDFSLNFRRHTRNVRRIFDRIFAHRDEAERPAVAGKTIVRGADGPDDEATSAHDSPASTPRSADYSRRFSEEIAAAHGYAEELSVLRRIFIEEISKIKTADLNGQISIRETKSLQTSLAEASIASALDIANRRVSANARLSILALGKLGGRTMDYGSDLDLVIVYDGDNSNEAAETQSRVVETFVNVLSSITRDGNLYRVDLRLRPHGSKGLIALPGNAFLDYLKNEAAIWELLAFVKLRGLRLTSEYAATTEAEAAEIIFDRARRIPAGELAAETRRVRLALEKSRVVPNRQSDVDIKYGAGGMLDVYFATRYLQLRDGVRDDPEDRSTARILEKLRERSSLSAESFTVLRQGYEFLAMLDHNLRLTVGRTRRLPSGNTAAIAKVVKRMNLGTAAELNEMLTVHRLDVRRVFDELLS